MKLKNKFMVGCLQHLRNSLDYLSDSLGKMYDETTIPMHEMNADLEDPSVARQSFEDVNGIEMPIDENEKPVLEEGGAPEEGHAGQRDNNEVIDDIEDVDGIEMPLDEIEKPVFEEGGAPEEGHAGQRDNNEEANDLANDNVSQEVEKHVNEADTAGLSSGCDNADFEKLLTESANMVKYYDSLSLQWNADQQMIVADITLKIIENMLLSGCKAIDDDKVYDMKRHQLRPYRLIPNGTPVKETIRPGVEWNGKVYVPAIVCV